MAAVTRTPGGAALASLPLALQPTSPSIGPNNRLQRDVSRACVDCGAPVMRARRARGPLPMRCVACTVARRPRGQLRAYLRAAERLADGQGLVEVSAALATALTALDAAESDR